MSKSQTGDLLATCDFLTRFLPTLELQHSTEPARGSGTHARIPAYSPHAMQRINILAPMMTSKPEHLGTPPPAYTGQLSCSRIAYMRMRRRTVITCSAHSRSCCRLERFHCIEAAPLRGAKQRPHRPAQPPGAGSVAPLRGGEQQRLLAAAPPLLAGAAGAAVGAAVCSTTRRGRMRSHGSRQLRGKRVLGSAPGAGVGRRAAGRGAGPARAWRPRVWGAPRSWRSHGGGRRGARGRRGAPHARRAPGCGCRRRAQRWACASRPAEPRVRPWLAAVFSGRVLLRAGQHALELCQGHVLKHCRLPTFMSATRAWPLLGWLTGGHSAQTFLPQCTTNQAPAVRPEPGSAVWAHPWRRSPAW